LHNVITHVCVVSAVENAEDFSILHGVLKSLDLCLTETFSSSNTSLSFDGHLHHLKRWTQEMKKKSKWKFAKTFSTGRSIRKDSYKLPRYFRLIPLHGLPNEYTEQQVMLTFLTQW